MTGPSDSLVLRQVWNRAVETERLEPYDGDVALRRVVLFHGQVVGGGLHYAVEVVAPDELARAADAYDYFDLHATAQVIRSAATCITAEDGADPSEELEALGELYFDEVADDEVLTEALRRRFEDHPTDFAPME